MTKTPIHAAVIDIGSNSIRFLHAAVTPQGVTVFLPKQLITTRLAEGLAQTGELSGDAMARSMRAIAHYADIARGIGVEALYAYATSAVRDAKNSRAFLHAVQSGIGLHADVLSCEEEARLAYIGAVGERGGGLIDIGGGSAQIMAKDAVCSFPLGCVRAKDLFGHIPFENLQQAIALWLSSGYLTDALSSGQWTGVGGTITTLGALHANLEAYDSAIVNGRMLTLAHIQALYEQLHDLGEDRAAHPLLRERHDVILYGAALLLVLMRELHISAIRVSDADGMEGYLLNRAARNG